MDSKFHITGPAFGGTVEQAEVEACLQEGCIFLSCGHADRENATCVHMLRCCRSTGGFVRRPSSPVGSVTHSGGNFGSVQKPDDVSTLRLYKDCMRLTYHIAAQVWRSVAHRQRER